MVTPEPEDAEPENPKPSRPLGTAEEATEKVKSAVADLGEADADGEPLDPKSLPKLTAYYPFMRFFCWLAIKRNPQLLPTQQHVSRMRFDHSKLYKFSVVADLVFVGFAAAMLLVAIGIVIYKTLWL